MSEENKEEAVIELKVLYKIQAKYVFANVWNEYSEPYKSINERIKKLQGILDGPEISATLEETKANDDPF